MIIDDEEFCISCMDSMLGLLGINVKNHVDFCINGQEAVDKLIESYGMGLKYSLIFTDFQMPVMDGIKATYKMRKVLLE